MYDSILQAEVSIYIEMYIFEDTLEQFHFFDVLRDKSQKGLRVKLILDAFGSIDLSDITIEKLKKSGVEIRFQSYLFHRAHRKIIIIDEKTAFIGGVNIDNSSSRWNDLVVRIEGMLVKQIVKSFAKSYRDCGGKDELL